MRPVIVSWNHVDNKMPVTNVPLKLSKVSYFDVNSYLLLGIMIGSRATGVTCNDSVKHLDFFERNQ